MKNMKKLFSKIVTLVLLVAMLIPFTSIPKVEADDTCSGDWEYHTNYYFFLQAEHPHTWTTYLADDGFVQTNYYTSFLYNFPSDGSTIEFLDEGFVKIVEGDSARDYSESFNPGTEANRKTWTAAQFYYEFQNEAKREVTKYGNYSNYIFTTGNNKGTNEERIVTYLFHGDWAHLPEGTNAKWDLNDVNFENESLEIESRINKLVNSSILIAKNDSELSDVQIGAAGLESGSLDFQMKWVRDAIQTYNRYSSTDETIRYQQTGAVQYYEDAKNPIIQLVIGRKYTTSDVFENGEIITDADGDYAISVGNESYKLTMPVNGEEKYITYTNGNKTVNASEQKTVVIEDNNGDEVSWFLAPTLYQMSYRVCKANNDANEGSVTVTYDGNDANATNVPSPETKTMGSAFTVSTQEPTLSGNTFQVWSTDKNCGNAGTKYEPGSKLSDSLNNNTTLFACWGATGTTPPKGTGVLTYAGLFTGIIALAGGTYYIVKKKNMFKKI